MISSVEFILPVSSGIQQSSLHGTGKSNLTCTVHGFIFMLSVPCWMWLNKHSAVVYDLLADVPRMVHYKTSDGLIDSSGSWSGFVSLLVILHIFKKKKPQVCYVSKKKNSPFWEKPNSKGSLWINSALFLCSNLPKKHHLT